MNSTQLFSSPFDLEKQKKREAGLPSLSSSSSSESSGRRRRRRRRCDLINILIESTEI
jgi:hypothetical protein